MPASARWSSDAAARAASGSPPPVYGHLKRGRKGLSTSARGSLPRPSLPPPYPARQPRSTLTLGAQMGGKLWRPRDLELLNGTVALNSASNRAVFSRMIEHSAPFSLLDGSITKSSAPASIKSEPLFGADHPNSRVTPPRCFQPERKSAIPRETQATEIRSCFLVQNRGAEKLPNNPPGDRRGLHGDAAPDILIEGSDDL